MFKTLNINIVNYVLRTNVNSAITKDYREIDNSPTMLKFKKKEIYFIINVY